jgi:hypothetical protein
VWLTRLARGRIELVVFLIALLARAAVLLTGGGLRGNLSYDGAVYYSAADALTFGRLPYRDFVLVHPPGSMLALTPFAVFGRITTDHRGFVLAVLATMVIGAINAVLVVRIARRMGLGRLAAAVGGSFYAVWSGSVASEYVVRLEPLGNLCLLVGLLLFLRLDSDARRGRAARPVAVLCGASFAAAVTVKIWWAAPLVLLLLWCATPARRWRLPWLGLGSALSLALVDGPFFAAAPRQMFNMIVADQFRRPRGNLPLSLRVGDMFGLIQVQRPLGIPLTRIVALLLCAVLVVIMLRASTVKAARFAVLLTGVQAGVLLLTPSWYSYYADYLAPPLALTLAAAAGAAVVATRRRRADPARRLIPGQRHARGRRLTGWAMAGLVVGTVVGAGCATSYFLAVGPKATVALPDVRLQALVRNDYCVMSDSPMGLILSDTLSRDFAHDCPNWVDVTGRSLGVDAMRSPNGVSVVRLHNTKWQHDVLHYLRSGDTVLILRLRLTGLTRASLRSLRSGGELAAGPGFALYRTPDPHRAGTRRPDVDIRAGASTRRRSSTEPVRNSQPTSTSRLR